MLSSITCLFTAKVCVVVLQQHIPGKGIPSSLDGVPVPGALEEWKYMVLYVKWGHVCANEGGSDSTLPWRTGGGKA